MNGNQKDAIQAIGQRYRESGGFLSKGDALDEAAKVLGYPAYDDLRPKLRLAVYSAFLSGTRLDQIEGGDG